MVVFLAAATVGTVGWPGRVRSRKKGRLDMGSTRQAVAAFAIVTLLILVAVAAVAGTLGQFEPNGKPPTKGFVAVHAYKWIRDNAPDAIEHCDKQTDQYTDLRQTDVSEFKREAINCLASVGFFNNYPGLAVPLTTSTTAPTTIRLSDNEIKRILIRESIASYSGSCACPYSTARNGSRCGARSAWSRPGGAQPLCYLDDVTKEMIDRYRRQRG